MKHLLTVLLVFATCVTVLYAGESNALPEQITVGGITYEDIRWGKVTATWVSITHKSGVASLRLDELPRNLQERFGYDPELVAKQKAELERQQSELKAKQEQVAREAQQKQAEAVATAASQEAERQKKEDIAKQQRKYEFLYNSSMRYASQAKYLAYYQRTDREFIEDQMPLRLEFINAYEGNQEKRQAELFETITKQREEFFAKKTPVGFEYNEIIKDEVAHPINFSLFSNSDSCYLSIGDGTFSVLNRPTGNNLVGFFKGIQKALEWSEQCYKEKLDADKEVGTWGGLSMTLVSKDNGRWSYVWLTIRGTWGEEHLLEKKTVRVDLLNLSCLHYKIRKLNELLSERERLKKNADRLK